MFYMMDGKRRDITDKSENRQINTEEGDDGDWRGSGC